MAVALRDGTRDDVPAIAALVRGANVTHRAWAPQIDVPPLDLELEEWHERFDRSCDVRVAERDGELVAAGAWARAVGEVPGDGGGPVPGTGHVNAVFVRADLHGQGLARLVLADLEARMAAAGCHRARLWTIEGSPAEKLYARAGWERTDRRTTHPPTGMGVVQYVRSLAPRA
jgi:GNAT superfamily N-acetyltransferase